ncbi:hypothetical protein GXW83_27445 [Streptacidiphilus sp. PB12-B1b]|uniref:hypothetical protein n=1 Tax=Streptacidiphilus sp. PB12-B1b TaxID=2705012 RepID=UPI0015FC3F8D|nr:hypothetical protein [Streptacidiphilus sp. PB12-B1b]QMU78880.1 hypothetical protein GXW83_27445 [Streptacidiphilus sp. PB12-B1b]
MTTPSWAQPAPEPPAKKPAKKSDTCVGCGCVTLLVVGVIVGAVALFGGSHSSTATTASSAPTTAVAQPVAPAPTTGAPTPKPTTDSVGQQVSDWWNNGGQADEQKISGDFNTIGNDSSQDTAAVGSDCSTLSKDVAAAQQHAPIPDPAAEQHWSAALADYRAGASDCLTGVADGDTALVMQASGEIGQGNTELGAATTRIGQIADAAG